MKNIFKKLLTAVLAFSMIFMLVAAEEEKTLADKFGYKEDFEYEDEMVAHALKSAVVYVQVNYVAKFKVYPLTIDIDEVSALWDANPHASSYDVAEYILADENIDYYFTKGSAKTVSVDTGIRGSGVVISEDGYIATNSHVASGITDSMKEECKSMYANDTITDCVYDIESDALAIGLEFEYYMMDYLYEVMMEDVSIQDEKETIYVCFPASDGDARIKKNRMFEAEIVAEGTSAEVSPDGFTQDVAILKIDEENLVSLALSESYPESNSKIVSAGFPAAADVIFTNDAESDESVLSVTIGTGNISRQVPIKGTNYKAMEITTTISGGSSGGPSVDAKLNIEGLNTYGNSSDMRFAYMVPAEYINDLLDDENIDLEREDISKTFLTGIQMLQGDYGKAALECFEEVKDKRGDTPYIDNLIELAEKAPQEYPEGVEEEQEEQAAEEDETDYKLIIIFAAGGVLLVAIIVVVVLVVVKSRKKANKEKEEQETIIRQQHEMAERRLEILRREEEASKRAMSMNPTPPPPGPVPTPPGTEDANPPPPRKGIISTFKKP